MGLFKSSQGSGTVTADLRRDDLRRLIAAAPPKEQRGFARKEIRQVLAYLDSRLPADELVRDLITTHSGWDKYGCMALTDLRLIVATFKGGEIDVTALPFAKIERFNYNTLKAGETQFAVSIEFDQLRITLGAARDKEQGARFLGIVHERLNTAGPYGL